ncbi:hypothetical protein AAVH_01346 [Aphelenchoides avenae]|nr:hypothetical protein AAVH_01346 [Aphelenchus avenae]
MGAVMRGEQTLRLIQLYHSHYPEIARNTQDADGRKLRTQLWQIITDELNAAYQTSFSVEQYKKKIQNVQCTSRQKAHAGKRSLGAAELEYLKLFEKDLLEPLLSGSDISREGSTHSRNSSNEAPSTPALPMEQLLEGFALSFEQSSSNDTDGNDKPGAVTDGSVISAQNLNAAEQLILALGQLSQQAMVNGTLNGTHAAEDDRQDLKPDVSNGVNEAPKSPALLKAARKRRNGILPNDGLLNKKAKDGSDDASSKLSAQMTEVGRQWL